MPSSSTRFPLSEASDRKPFSLGIPGEEWNSNIGALMVPVGARFVIVHETIDRQYNVIGNTENHMFGNVLALAAWVHTLVTSGGYSEEAKEP